MRHLVWIIKQKDPSAQLSYMHDWWKWQMNCRDHDTDQDKSSLNYLLNWGRTINNSMLTTSSNVGHNNRFIWSKSVHKKNKFAF